MPEPLRSSGERGSMSDRGGAGPQDIAVEAGGIRWRGLQCGAGPGMLLVHGAGASSHSWRRLMPLLATHYRVLAVDLPGHGGSSMPSDGRVPIERISAALGALIAKLQLAPQVAVGHSAGAAVICRLALDGAIRPRCLIAINGALLPPPGLPALWFAPAARLLAGSDWLAGLIARLAGNPQSVRRLIASTGSTLDADGVAGYVRLVSDPRHVSGALALFSQWDLGALRAELPRLDVPLVLIVTENDRAVPPSQARQVERLVPGARHVLLPHLGHLAHEESPRLLADEILRAAQLHQGAGAP